MENQFLNMNSNESKINELINFADRRYSINKVKNIYKAGLELLQGLEIVESAVLFLYNESKFDFEFNIEVPQEERSSIIFDELVESGLIPKALKEGSIIIEDLPEINLSLAAAPIKGKEEYYGIIILKLNKQPENIQLFDINFISLTCNYISLAVDELKERTKRKNVQELLEQIVATRTIEIEKSKKVLDDKLESLTSNLIMSIPHEVRTPINQVLGFTNFLKDYYNDKTREDYEDINEILNDIRSSTERLKRLFENYIYYANLSVVSNDVKQLENIRKLITPSAASLITERAMSKAYILERAKDLSINLVESAISLDETYFMKVVDEIIDNSFKYSEEGNKVEISSYIDDDSYTIEFLNEGIGIGDNFVNQLGTYMQFDRKRNEQQGIGLGLAIVMKILHLHGGDIDLKGELGKFANVIIKIPVSNMSEY